MIEKARRIIPANPAPKPMIIPTIGGPTLPSCEVSGVVKKTHARPNGVAVPMIDRRPGQKNLANDDTKPVNLTIKRRENSRY